MIYITYNYNTNPVLSYFMYFVALYMLIFRIVVKIAYMKLFKYTINKSQLIRKNTITKKKNYIKKVILLSVLLKVNLPRPSVVEKLTS